MPIEDWHVAISVAPPEPWGAIARWAKCDMLATVGYSRLNLPHEKNAISGSRRYFQIQVDAHVVTALRTAVAKAIGLG